MIEQSISWGNLLTIAIALLGFFGGGIVNAIIIGKYFGSNDRRLEGVDKRLEAMEESEKHMTEILINIAQQKSEIKVLSDRISDVQQYGSHKLAEVLDAMRRQIMNDVKERFEYLHADRTRERKVREDREAREDRERDG